MIALIAAYIVALQALLLPLSVAAGAPGGTLCASTSSPASSHPGAAPACPCAAGCGIQCCAGSLFSPPQAIAFGVIRASLLAPPSPPAAVAVARPSLHNPQLARAPPAA